MIVNAHTRNELVKKTKEKPNNYTSTAENYYDVRYTPTFIKTSKKQFTTQ